MKRKKLKTDDALLGMVIVVFVGFLIVVMVDAFFRDEQFRATVIALTVLFSGCFVIAGFFMGLAKTITYLWNRGIQDEG